MRHSRAKMIILPARRSRTRQNRLPTISSNCFNLNRDRDRLQKYWAIIFYISLYFFTDKDFPDEAQEDEPDEYNIDYEAIIDLFKESRDKKTDSENESEKSAKESEKSTEESKKSGEESGKSAQKLLHFREVSEEEFMKKGEERAKSALESKKPGEKSKKLREKSKKPGGKSKDGDKNATEIVIYKDQTTFDQIMNGHRIQMVIRKNEHNERERNQWTKGDYHFKLSNDPEAKLKCVIFWERNERFFKERQFCSPNEDCVMQGKVSYRTSSLRAPSLISMP